RPAPTNRSGGHARRRTLVVVDVLRPRTPRVRAVRRREHPDRTRRPRYVDVQPRTATLGTREGRERTTAACQLAARGRVRATGLDRTEAEALAVTARRTRDALATEGEEGAAHRRLHLHFDHRIRQF